VKIPNTARSDHNKVDPAILTKARAASAIVGRTMTTARRSAISPGNSSSRAWRASGTRDEELLP